MKKDIEWIVLDYDEDEGKALLLSRYVLDTHVYNDEFADVTWETCTLRTWLNETFLYNDKGLLAERSGQKNLKYH